VTAGQVRLQFQALSGHAEQVLVAVELERSFMPRKDAVADLMPVGEPRSRFGLGQVDEGQALAVHQRTQDALPGPGLLGRDVRRELTDVDNGREADGFRNSMKWRRNNPHDAGLPKRLLGGGEDLPARQLVELTRAQGASLP